MDFPHITWHKSSYSSQQGNCVEVGAWHTSSHSIGNGGECVEVSAGHRSSHSTQQGSRVEAAAGKAAVLARDSKDPDGPVLGFGTEAWEAFLTTVKTGSLDLR